MCDPPAAATQQRRFCSVSRPPARAWPPLPRAGRRATGRGPRVGLAARPARPSHPARPSLGAGPCRALPGPCSPAAVRPSAPGSASSKPCRLADRRGARGGGRERGPGSVRWRGVSPSWHAASRKAPVSPPPSRPGDSASADSGRAKSPVDSANYVARTTHPARLGALKSAQVLSLAINEVLKIRLKRNSYPPFLCCSLSLAFFLDVKWWSVKVPEWKRTLSFY